MSAATNAHLSQAQIDAIRQRKTELACAEIAASKIALRPGVSEVIALARQRGAKLAFVTTTYRPNIATETLVSRLLGFAPHEPWATRKPAKQPR